MDNKTASLIETNDWMESCQEYWNEKLIDYWSVTCSLYDSTEMWYRTTSIRALLNTPYISRVQQLLQTLQVGFRTREWNNIKILLILYMNATCVRNTSAV